MAPGSNPRDWTAAVPRGTLHLTPALITAYYAEWTKGKWHIAGEYWRVPFILNLQAGIESFTVPIDQRSWYPMVSYQLTKRLQVGTYYHFLHGTGIGYYDASNPDGLKPKSVLLAARVGFTF